jgi:hypothetical protein
MAMIDCRECEGKISERAKTCPHCGCPNEHPIQTNALPISAGVAIFLVLIFLIYASFYLSD